MIVRKGKSIFSSLKHFEGAKKFLKIVCIWSIL